MTSNDNIGSFMNITQGEETLGTLPMEANATLIPASSTDNYTISHHEIYLFYPQLSVFLLGHLALFVELIGIVANCLSIRIFTTKYMKSSPINWFAFL